MLSRASQILIVFAILLTNSPWFNILLGNKELLLPFQSPNKSVQQESLIDKTNTLRGELNNVINPKISKLIVNKYTVTTRESFKIYLESFDPHFLFFTGTNDAKEHTGFNGPLYLSILLLLLYGLNLSALGLLLVAALPTVILQSPKDIVPLMGFLTAISFIAARGFLNLKNKHRNLAILISILLIFEMVRFRHNFQIHYPEILWEHLSK